MEGDAIFVKEYLGYQEFLRKNPHINISGTTFGEYEKAFIAFTVLDDVDDCMGTGLDDIIDDVGYGSNIVDAINNLVDTIENNRHRVGEEDKEIKIYYAQ